MITVDTWPISQIDSYRKQGNLNLQPEYQRRPVWQLKDRMFLIDSIFRRVPIGAVTLFVDKSRSYDYYEVIDGKQRLTSILDYLEDSLIVKRSVVEKLAEEDEDERDQEGSEGPLLRLYDVKFSQLDHPDRMRVLQYKVPVFLVEGSRADAVYAFTRMNRTNYTLKPQEIRNAVFMDSAFLKAAMSVLQELDTIVGGSFLLRNGVVSKQGLDRMQDVQLISELLLLVLEGPQHRRDSLDRAYEHYRSPGPSEQAELDAGCKALIKICQQLGNIFRDTAMQAAHFPSACEHDYYGLVGALHARKPLTAPQMAELGNELYTVIEEFRRNVEEFVAAVRQGRQIEPDDFDRLVEDYGRGFLGGQINSIGRRKERIEIWRQVIDGVVATLDKNSAFSPMQRRLIWVRSVDKICERCKEVVEWKDFHAGHRVPWALGGKTEVDNGQVEHAVCNQRAGAS